MPECNVQSWSLSLGQWWGVPVRLHIFCLLFGTLTIAFSLSDPALIVPGLLALVVVFVSLLLHEMAHAVAALRVGGQVDALVLGPVGGLCSPRVPDEPEAKLFVAIAGPILHSTLVVGAAVLLLLRGEANMVIGLLNPIVPTADFTEGSLAIVTIKLTLWLNWVFLLLNLLPTFPFDGGPALRALLWPALGRRTARIVTSRAAMAVALGCFVLAILFYENELSFPFPLWLPLVILGIFLIFSARQDLILGSAHELADELAGYHLPTDGLDLLDQVWSEDGDEETVLVEHPPRRSQRREQHLRAEEAHEDARVDDILARLHRSSLEDLSPEELSILQRASNRYRAKEQDGKA